MSRRTIIIDIERKSMNLQKLLLFPKEPNKESRIDEVYVPLQSGRFQYKSIALGVRSL